MFLKFGCTITSTERKRILLMAMKIELALTSSTAPPTISMAAHMIASPDIRLRIKFKFMVILLMGLLIHLDLELRESLLQTKKEKKQ